MLHDADVIALIPVTDPARSKQFYEDTLGLRFVDDDGFAQVFESGGRWLRLTKVEKLEPQEFSIIGWQVPDMAASVRGLTQKGVEFLRYGFMEQDELGIWSTPDGAAKVAWFRDPDGNVLSLVEAKPMRPSAP